MIFATCLQAHQLKVSMGTLGYNMETQELLTRSERAWWEKHWGGKKAHFSPVPKWLAHLDQPHALEHQNTRRNCKQNNSYHWEWGDEKFVRKTHTSTFVCKGPNDSHEPKLTFIANRTLCVERWDQIFDRSANCWVTFGQCLKTN
jgi:hypothetical protein